MKRRAFFGKDADFKRIFAEWKKFKEETDRWFGLNEYDGKLSVWKALSEFIVSNWQKASKCCTT